MRTYVEERIGKLTDEEFALTGAVVKNYILGELGGSVKESLAKELMLHAAIRVRSYTLKAWKEA